MLKLERTRNWVGLHTLSRIQGLMLMVVFASHSLLPAAKAQSSDAITVLTVPTYRLRDLGVLPGFTSSSASAMNIQGEVVGTAYNSQTGISHAFLYRRGRLFDIGALLGPTKSSWANAINAEGEVIGEFNEGDGPESSFVYRRGQLQTFAFFNGPYDFTWMTAINDLGQIVGNYSTYSTADDTFHAYLRQPTGTIVQLPSFGGETLIPRSINDRGQIVGEVAVPAFNDFQHPVLTQPGGLAPRDLGTLGANAYPANLNNQDQAIGYSQIAVDENLNGPFYAVLYAGGKVINLGTLPGGDSSFAIAINDFGQIVGSSSLRLSTGILGEHGFVYLKGKMHDLNTLLEPTATRIFTVTDADGINDVGQIVATATDGSGETHAVILTPRFR